MSKPHPPPLQNKLPIADESPSKQQRKIYSYKWKYLMKFNETFLEDHFQNIWCYGSQASPRHWKCFDFWNQFLMPFLLVCEILMWIQTQIYKNIVVQVGERKTQNSKEEAWRCHRKACVLWFSLNSKSHDEMSHSDGGSKAKFQRCPTKASFISVLKKSYQRLHPHKSSSLF